MNYLFPKLSKYISQEQNDSLLHLTKRSKQLPRNVIEAIILGIPQKEAAMKAMYNTGYDMVFEMAQYSHMHYRTVSRKIR